MDTISVFHLLKVHCVYSLESPTPILMSTRIIPVGNGIWPSCLNHYKIWISQLWFQKAGKHAISVRAFRFNCILYYFIF